MFYYRFSVTWGGISKKRLRLIKELSERCEKLYVYLHAEDKPCVPSGKKSTGRTRYWMEISDTRIDVRLVRKTWLERIKWEHKRKQKRKRRNSCKSISKETRNS